MQIDLFYSNDASGDLITALNTLPQRDEDMADDDDEAFEDEMQDEEDLYQLRTNDNDRELDPEDDDHLPEEDLQ